MITIQSGRLLSWALTAGIMVIGSNSFVLSPILGDVARDMEVHPAIVARAISAFGAATAVSSLIYARYGGGVSVRRVLSVGAAVMALCFIVSAISETWHVLALAQGVVGLAVGQMLPTIYATATASAPEGQGAQILGRVIRGWAIALVLGVPFSAFVSDLAGWRAVYYVLAGFAGITAVAFTRIPLGAEQTADRVVISVKQALVRPGAVPLLAICLLYMTAFYGLYPFLGVRLGETFGASATMSGFVVLTYGAGFGVASTCMSWVDRAGPARVFPGILGFLCLVYVALVPATTSYPGALAAGFVWGMANHIGVNLIILFLSRRGDDARPVLMGLHTTITYGAIFLGPFVCGMLYAANGFPAASFAAAGLLAGAGLVAWTKRHLM